MSQDVRLVEITQATVDVVLGLAVAPEQARFVATNAVSLAQAHFEPGAWFRAIARCRRPRRLRHDLRPDAPRRRPLARPRHPNHHALALHDRPRQPAPRLRRRRHRPPRRARPHPPRHHPLRHLLQRRPRRPGRLLPPHRLRRHRPPPRGRGRGRDRTSDRAKCERASDQHAGSPARGTRRTRTHPSSWSRTSPRPAPGRPRASPARSGPAPRRSPRRSGCRSSPRRSPPRAGRPGRTARSDSPIVSAKAIPLQTPTSPSRRMKRRMFAAPRLRVASARTVTVSACVPALPPIEATIGISTASATKARMVSVNCEITVAARIAAQRFTASQTNRPRAICEDPVAQLLVADAGEQADVLLGLLLQRLHRVVDGDDPDQPAVGVHHRRRDQVVLVEDVGHVLLPLVDAQRAEVLVHQLLEPRRPRRAHQPAERHHAHRDASAGRR